MKIPKSGKMMLSLIAVPLIAYGVICLLFFMFQRQMIYYPVSEVSVPEVPYIFLDTGEVRIKVWTLNTGRSRALIYFGGNAENVAYNIDDFRDLFPGYTVYLVNYRGYGGSSRSPGEEGFRRDALLVYDHFARHHGSVSVMGRSIGAAVATYLASKRRVERLLLVTPFDSAAEVAKQFYPYLPVSLILRERLDAAAMAPEVTARTLIIAAGDDEFIPEENSRSLEKAFVNTEAQYLSVGGAGHNTIQLHPDYRAAVAAFMR